MFEVQIKVQPSSSKRKVLLQDDNSVKIYLTSQPEKNKANKELINILSKKLNVPKSKVSITKGGTSRKKTIQIDDVLSMSEFTNKLL